MDLEIIANRKKKLRAPTNSDVDAVLKKQWKKYAPVSESLQPPIF